nr:retrovirus-related Pol polyprotein from transposon TNT 1-94 [Tanacetum cinerariifolium]
KEFGMIAGCDSEDAIKEGAAKLYNLITGANSKAANTAGDAGEFALMGVTSEETPFLATRDEGIFDSGCSRSMTGNKERLDDFQSFQDIECLVLSKDFKLSDNSMVVLKVLLGFLLEHKDETSLILKNFINLVENHLNKKVKAIRCDNRIEFKNAQMIELCGSKRIKRDYSNSRTSQQNRAAGRKNRTLIEAAKTMLVDFKLPTMFWTEAVRTACYVLNRVLVTSPYNKTPYALLTGNLPSVSHFKPFGCHVTILNTSDHFGKFDGKADEGYIVGYSAINKAYRYQLSLKIIPHHKHSAILHQSLMATLKYKEEHNKVGYLLKPAGSDDYHQIIDFLSESHIRAPELGPPAILATIDNTLYTITKELGMVSNIGNAKKFLMYLRFLQTILGIETRVTRQYKVLAFSSKLFANMRLNFEGHPMPLLLAILLQAQAGGGAEVAEQAVPHPMPAPDQSLTHLPTPSRPQTSKPVAPILEHDHSSNPYETAAGSFPSMKDAPLGGNFHTSPPRSSQAPPAGQPSRGGEDPITLIALSSVVSTLVQKVHSLEAELHDHKKLFKDVMGKLVKKVKTVEVKLKTKKRKMVVSYSNQEDGTTQNVDLDALRTLANAAVAVDSDLPSDSTSQILAASPCATTDVPPATFAIPLCASDAPTGASTILPSALNVSTAASVVPADSPTVPADSPNVSAGVFSKGKFPMVEEDILIKARTFRQMEEDRLGEEVAKRLHEEEMAQMERERAEVQSKRQQDVLDSAMYYTESDWLTIRAQVEANASLSKTLLGDDVSKDNFPAQMSALIKKKRQALAEQLFKERQNRPMTPAQQKAYMRQYVKNQSSVIYNTGWTIAYVQALKRLGPVLEEPSTKRPKSPEAPTLSMPEVPISPAVTSPLSLRTRRKSLGRKHMHKPKYPLPKLDFDAPAQTFLKVLPTPLGEINALYRIDSSTKHFATLCQILHMVDRQDLMKLYGLVVQYYEHHPSSGAGLLFWGDLQGDVIIPPKD